MRIIDLYNPYHLGDSVFMMILFYNIKDYIENNNIIINYYCNENYHNQLNEFNCTNNVKLLNYTENNIGLNVWIGNNNLKYNYFNNNLPLNDFYVIFFNQLLELCDIKYKINYLMYKDEKLLNRYNKYNNIDYLIINSVPLSNQYNYNEDDWNNLCIKLNQKYKIITTKKIDGILCTLDDNLTIKDIASLSTQIKNIIGVNTGVMPGLFNEYTLNNINVLYYFDDNVTYSYSKFVKKTNINDLNFLVNDTKLETFNDNIIYFMCLFLGLIFFYLIIKKSLFIS